MSTKQNKFYETSRQTQANTFSDGLNMDLHPLTTPNTILTDCVNGTMITYNDNEFVLQNDRGNTKIPDAQLSKGFIPVGMKEHNGILYIVSHNPQTKESEIGTFPSPKQTSNFIGSVHTGTLELESTNTYEYTKINVPLNYYSSEHLITPRDKYYFKIESGHPLFVLEHYILSENGELSPIKLQDGDEYHRFTHVGKGKLGYTYRPHFIESLTVTPKFIKGSKHSLQISVDISDKELISKVRSLSAEI